MVVLILRVSRPVYAVVRRRRGCLLLPYLRPLLTLTILSLLRRRLLRRTVLL